ncbi:hypothetical protein FB385_1197 [Paramicrobacterium agarici]|uniref:Uncharacterized protein n=1 Tax=Paramicrobacterium agarici TaxID=630514 RepID=A0A2A9DTZ2_9MICO|nr:hypothetical protein [Microbacterium agarici]PFG29359.1 hypothetical protein ATJ78_0264 [Microbacterium agarici]TQO22367.1 hypothetical protein FB385_1197 [Microbacterium agarici]
MPPSCLQADRGEPPENGRVPNHRTLAGFLKRRSRQCLAMS